MNGLREQFESWLLSRSYYIKSKMHLRQTSDGHYQDFRVNDRWIAFNAGVKIANRNQNDTSRI